MSISLEEVRHVAKLARLELSEQEMVALQSELNALLGLFSEIESLDFDAIEGQSHAVSLQNVWADDIPEEPLDRTAALQNSALARAGLFVVPTIIED
ncbi:MAG: Asp-tRNA(Asn)/Glu-tRNA(Gln) amidotransferase subunit GatC [Armatimonadetes bacterium]|jgi:aspartyl-tRNA(Asn)/glutamyl-tRNA(Gln) amidotransferase subunit C|nr:Asp-tRNA(Asn)/Glu-tRNA(Gln) amidotransferase subunit GatC [Armatimonadota bacterium]MCA1995622.1 Asp-tRNA(Asn)/Glu-tRNA(Gln) amidotransferase subunit GatC [Armatimonadota bacterium]